MADKLSARGWHEKNCVKYWDFDPLSDGIVRNIHRLEEDYAKYFAAELADENKRLHRIEEQRNEFEQLANAYRIKFETAEARLTAAREVLKAVEWRIAVQTRAAFCPLCLNIEEAGHAPGCELDAMLNKEEVKC